MTFEQKPLEVKPAKATKKEAAERPFSFFDLKRTNSEITIEESLDFENDRPRVVRVPNFKTPGNHETIAIKVSDGLFVKDLHMNVDEWVLLCSVIPSTLVNLKGVTVRISKGAGYETKVEYLRIYQPQPNTSNMNENFPAKSPQDATGQTDTSISRTPVLVRQLSHAVELNAKMGIKTDRELLNKMADAISPGKGLDLIVAAKTEGWIYEKDGIFRGE